MDVFFYGLFMDEGLLAEQGLRPANARMAKLEGYRLRIAQRANLIEDRDATAYGVVIALPSEDVEQLYSEASVSDYRAVSVCAQLADGSEVTAACYLLPPGTCQEGSNPEYARKLYELAKKLGFPEEELARISQAADSSA